MLKRAIAVFAVIADMNTIWTAGAIAKNEDIKLVLQIKVDGLRGKTVDRPARPVDTAPALAAVLGIKLPSSTSGEPLVEVLQNTD